MANDPHGPLPAFATADMLGQPISRPSGAEERRLGRLAWAMMEKWSTPSGIRCTGFSREWLSAHGWSVALLPFHLSEADDERIRMALAGSGIDSLHCPAVDARWPQPSAVWRLPLDEGALRHLWILHGGVRTLSFPEARSLALHADGDEVITVAGPKHFVRDAIGDDPAAVQLRFADYAARMDADGQSDLLASAIRHAAPHLLRE